MKKTKEEREKSKKRFINKLRKTSPHLKEAEIEGVLYLLFESKETQQLQELITKTGIPAQTLKEFLKSLAWIKDLNKIELTKEGREELKRYNLKPFSWTLVEFKDKKLEEKLLELRKKYDLENEESKREYDQFFATSNTTIKKVEALKTKGIQNKSIAIIGDDDLVSVALALKYNPLKVTVLEIDEDIINTINRIAEDYNLNIEASHYDAREDVPLEHKDKYDAVITDPPYTPAGIEIFLDRSISLLKKDKTHAGPYIFLYYGNSFKSPEKALKIQNIFNKYNLYIEDVIYKFSRYIGAQSIGSASTLYILKTTQQTFARRRKVQNIYTYQKNTVEKFPYVEHYTIRLGNIPFEFFRSTTFLDKTIRKFCKKHSLQIVDSKATRFSKGGKTLTYILSNSNLNVHTWPEKKALHINILVCSPIKNTNQMIDNLATMFKTDDIDVRRVE